MRRIAPLLAAFLIGALLFALAPASADRSRLKQRVAALEKRVEVLEEGAQGGAGIRSELDYLYRVNSNLDTNGRYWGVVRRFQIRLDEDDSCTNNQPRQATWDNSRLYCGPPLP